MAAAAEQQWWQAEQGTGLCAGLVCEGQDSQHGPGVGGCRGSAGTDLQRGWHGAVPRLASLLFH